MKRKPVTAEELAELLLVTIVREFAGRPLDVETACHSLAPVAERMTMAYMHKVAQPK